MSVPHTKLGFLKDGLGARLNPGTGSSPSVVHLDGSRALARYKFARELAGEQWDAQAKDRINRLDDAMSSPWVLRGADVLRYLEPADLNLRLDALEVANLEDQATRARAVFPRWFQNEDDSWRFRKGSIDPAHSSEVASAIRDLGWRRYGGLNPERGDSDALKGNSLFDFAYNSVADCGTKQDNLLAWAGGSGKTAAAMVLADYYQNTDSKAPIIVTGLKRFLKQTWIDDELPQLELLQKRHGADVYWESWLEASDKPKFNAPVLLISIERLKRLSDAQMAHLQKLARESTVICDEIYVCSNADTQATKALAMLMGNGGGTGGARHHIGLSGTPFRGRIEGAWSTFNLVFRPGSVAFPNYRMDRQGGRKAFEDDYTQWAISADGGRKRVPLLKNPDKFLEMTQHMISRRVRDEPEVEATLGKSIVQMEYVNVPWFAEHRAFYEVVLSQFREWYIRTKEAKGEAGVLTNEILVKLGFVVRAMAQPWAMKAPPPDETEVDDGKFKWEFPEYPLQPTGIMQWAMDEAVRQIEDGKQVIIAGRHVQQLDLIAQRLEQYRPAVSHGGFDLESRSLALGEFRKGRTPLLLGSYGTIAESLNLPMASFCIPMEATWDADSIKQTEWRMTRGVVQRVPQSRRLTTEGSIYSYMARWSGFKSEMSAAALDGKKQSMRGADVQDIQSFCNEIVGLSTEQRRYTLAA